MLSVNTKYTMVNPERKPKPTGQDYDYDYSNLNITFKYGCTNNKNPGPKSSQIEKKRNAAVDSWEAQCFTLISKSCLKNCKKNPLLHGVNI